MKKFRRWQRILLFSLLCLTVLAPILFVSVGRKELISDLSTLRYRRDSVQLNAIEQEEGEGLKGPKLVVYDEKELDSRVSYSASEENNDSKKYGNVGEIDQVSKRSQRAGSMSIPFERTNHESREENQQIPQETVTSRSEAKGQSNQTTAQHDQNMRSPVRRFTDEKVKQMKDDLIRAKAYLSMTPPGSNSHLVKELRLRIKESERAVGAANKDSDLSRRKKRSLEVTLSKASHVFPDCSAMALKLRAMTYNAEEQVRAQKNQASYLVQLSGRTTPKGLHCLSMRLTAEYFALSPEERQLPNQQRVHDADLYHYAVFSDNVLACAVVVNSTVSSAMVNCFCPVIIVLSHCVQSSLQASDEEPEKIVFHVVTDSLNLPAISMWFLLNPPGKATIQIQSLVDFKGLSAIYNSTLKQQNSRDSRYTSALNHLRFYLPYVFPQLNKIVLFDHDVVVQKDLAGLWSLNMKGKVIGAVDTCREGEPSFRRMDTLINFSDPFVIKRFDAKACTWAFGMNLFDLQEWRRHKLTALYNKYLQLIIPWIHPIHGLGASSLAWCEPEGPDLGDFPCHKKKKKHWQGYRRQLWKAGSLPLGWATFYNRTVILDRRWHKLGLGHEAGAGPDGVEQAAVLHYDGVMKPWLDIGNGRYKSYWSKYISYDHPYLQQCNIHE
ncbi:GALACTURONOSYLTRANSFERASE 4-RELATED [Salix purpurea]|uniref:Hexosyltransferase n=1 Tax=Salix purpurea TaxID=77065 RepID=A0A9Q0WUJ6_SALPP|nr:GALACTURONOSYLTRANSFERASE 4-RELATED [Salix purpurea]